MSFITELLTNASSGGLIGTVGGIATGVLNYFKTRQEHAFRIEEMKLGASLAAAKTAGDIALTREAGAASATWVSDLRGFTRPGLTWFFTFALFAIIATSLLNPKWLAEAPALLTFGITMVADTTGMMIAWWFGSRQIEKHLTRWGSTNANASVS